jgi:uncharacterized Zn finger protein (UPF0148 family)
MERKMFTLKCKDCGKAFEWPNPNKRFCPTCAEMREKKRNHEYKEKQKSLKFKKTPVNFSVTEVVSMLERYNRENKTRYTYGQFSELIRMGKV